MGAKGTSIEGDAGNQEEEGAAPTTPSQDAVEEVLPLVIVTIHPRSQGPSNIRCHSLAFFLKTFVRSKLILPNYYSEDDCFKVDIWGVGDGESFEVAMIVNALMGAMLTAGIALRGVCVAASAVLIKDKTETEGSPTATNTTTDALLLIDPSIEEEARVAKDNAQSLKHASTHVAIFDLKTLKAQANMSRGIMAKEDIQRVHEGLTQEQGGYVQMLGEELKKSAIEYLKHGTIPLRVDLGTKERRAKQSQEARPEGQPAKDESLQRRVDSFLDEDEPMQ